MNRAIHWFAENSVAANILMVIILAGGALMIPNIKQEVFPEFSTDMITISVVYLGAAPEEVEEGVCIRIEEQIQGIDGVKKITSKSAEGLGTVTVELLEGADSRSVLDEVKAKVDAIQTFPEEIESPVIQEVLVRNQVINVAVSGPTDERTLKVLGEQLRLHAALDFVGRVFSSACSANRLVGDVGPEDANVPGGDIRKRFAQGHGQTVDLLTVTARCRPDPDLFTRRVSGSRVN